MQKTLSNAQYFLAMERSSDSPSGRKYAKRLSAKARRAIDKKVVRESSDVFYDKSPVDEIENMIEWLWETGARPHCECGCGGKLLATLIETRDRGLSSVQELERLKAEEKKQQEIDLCWVLYATA